LSSDYSRQRAYLCQYCISVLVNEDAYQVRLTSGGVHSTACTIRLDNAIPVNRDGVVQVNYPFIQDIENKLTCTFQLVTSIHRIAVNTCTVVCFVLKWTGSPARAKHDAWCKRTKLYIDVQFCLCVAPLSAKPGNTAMLKGRTASKTVMLKHHLLSGIYGKYYSIFNLLDTVIDKNSFECLSSSLINEQHLYISTIYTLIRLHFPIFNEERIDLFCPHLCLCCFFQF